ncbi:MAG: hypothetical protein BWY09_00198 [Candidatus Hydrogenedentes bacterium ADurb.Bin179]|nr:MAG: hypothetical protein BWY09_00198 [Candidatus Hydrogenedentes bacterium ADurb.Bin179]
MLFTFQRTGCNVSRFGLNRSPGMLKHELQIYFHALRQIEKAHDGADYFFSFAQLARKYVFQVEAMLLCRRIGRGHFCAAATASAKEVVKAGLL